MTDNIEAGMELYEKALSALRDIMYTYKVMIDYSGFFDDFGSEDGKFDPEEFIDCDPLVLSIDEDEAKLLHEGCAIRIISGVLQDWGQGGHPERECYWVLMAKRVLEKKRLDHIPELREAMELSIESEKRFRDREKALFLKYVIGYFKRLIAPHCNQ